MKEKYKDKSRCPTCGGKLSFGMIDDKWVCIDCGMNNKKWHRERNPDWAPNGQCLNCGTIITTDEQGLLHCECNVVEWEK